MKRLLFILTFALAANWIVAQTSTQINFDQYAKKVEKSNAEIQDPKKNIKETTWISRAELMLDLYDAQLLRAYLEMDTKSFSLIVGIPKEQTQEEKDGQAIDKYVMDRVTFYFINGKLQYWEVTKPVVENPLDLSLESLNKAIELDVKNKKTDKIKEDLVKLKGYYINEGSSYYTKKDYKNAFSNFEKVIKVGQLPILSHKDTAIYYYAALSAQLAENYEAAIENYQEAIKLNYTSDGTAYYYIFDAYKSLNRADEGIHFLEDGFTKFPNNSNILFSLISYYLDKGDDPSKILVYIDKAIADEPNNSTLYFAKGTLYDRLGDIDEAVKSYSKAIELDPQSFNSYYNIGALYINSGLKLIEEANKVPSKEVDKYDSLMAKANDMFKKSLPYMEKANEIKPDTKEVIEALKSIYFRFRGESDEMNSKYLEYNEKLKNLQQ